ncbi:MAG: transposase [Arcicella sp.]|nr:transposase [Arcicella sp.]
MILSISRMNDISYQAVQRFYALKDLDCTLIRLLIFVHFVCKLSHHYLIATNEMVEAKAGKATHGIGLFYSSTNKRVVNLVSFLNLSLVDTVTEKSSMTGCQQMVKTENSRESKIASKVLKRGKDKYSVAKPVGRLKGSKNKLKILPAGISFTILDALLKLVLSLFAIYLPNLSYFHIVLDASTGTKII